MPTVHETVFDLVAKKARVKSAKITPESTLEELGLNSMDAVELMFEIEDHYNITIPDNRMKGGPLTAQAFVTVVEELLAQPKAAPTSFKSKSS